MTTATTRHPATLAALQPAPSSPHALWERMAARVDALVKHYRTDFDKHDRAILAAGPRYAPFVWTVGEMGTHLFTPESIARSKAGGWSGFGAAAEAAARVHENTETWLYDGLSFRQVTADIARRHVERWEKEAPEETQEHRDARIARGGW